MRTASINRDTMETQIRLSLELDGTGKAELDTGCGFLNHMLTLFARHGDFDLSVCCRGDIDVDDHHSVEDIGICLGRGTLISMVLVMCVLPQILLLGDSLVEKTSFTIGHHAAPQHLQGAMRVNGHVRGYINGYVDAEIHGRVNGTVSASIDIGNVQMEEAPAQTVPAADLHGEEGSDEKK